jgi:hypothetical protein
VAGDDGEIRELFATRDRLRRRRERWALLALPVVVAVVVVAAIIVVRRGGAVDRVAVRTTADAFTRAMWVRHDCRAAIRLESQPLYGACAEGRSARLDVDLESGKIEAPCPPAAFGAVQLFVALPRAAPCVRYEARNHHEVIVLLSKISGRWRVITWSAGIQGL